MANKYKKGDKVYVINPTHAALSHIEATVNSVRKFKMSYKYFVDIPGFDSQHFTVDELKKV